MVLVRPKLITAIAPMFASSMSKLSKHPCFTAFNALLNGINDNFACVAFKITQCAAQIAILTLHQINHL